MLAVSVGKIVAVRTVEEDASPGGRLLTEEEGTKVGGNSMEKKASRMRKTQKPSTIKTEYLEGEVFLTANRIHTTRSNCLTWFNYSFIIIILKCKPLIYRFLIGHLKKKRIEEGGKDKDLQKFTKPGRWSG